MSVLGEIRSQVLSVGFLVGVLGNLTASVLTAWGIVVRTMRKHHAEHMAALNGGHGPATAASSRQQSGPDQHTLNGGLER